MSKQYLKVGEVAKRTGVTIRTLHFYEEKGLLKPSLRTDAGYRLYSLDDLMQLQKIKSLQLLGLSLDEIVELEQANTPCLLGIINSHIKVLHKEIKRQSKLAERLTTIATRLTKEDAISIDMLIDALQETTMYEKYFTKEQVESLDKRKNDYDPEYFKQVEREWSDIFKGFEALERQNAEPSSEQAQALAAKAKQLIDSFTGGDKGIERSLDNMYQAEGGAKLLNKNGPYVDEKAYALFSKSLEILKNNS